MEIDYNTILTLTDRIDEYIYNHKDILKNPDTIVSRNLASNKQVAQLFIDLYESDPNKAILTLIYDHFNPVSIKTGYLKQRIPSGDIYTSVDFISGVISTFNRHHNHYFVPKKKKPKST